MNESTARAPSRVPFRDPSRTSTRRPKSSASPRRYSSPNSGSTSRGQDCQRRPRVQYSPRCSALGLPGARAYAVTGTPSDCVILGLGPLAEGDIGLVVSGINKGANVGNAVLGSGTTMATRVAHARSPRIPSIAVSLSLHGPRDHREPLFSLAARVSELLARRLVEGELPDGVTLNVNVPSVPRGETRGTAATRLSPIGDYEPNRAAMGSTTTSFRQSRRTIPTSKRGRTYGLSIGASYPSARYAWRSPTKSSCRR